MERAEEVLVYGFRMVGSTGPPGGDVSLSKAEAPFGSGSVQSFGECSQRHCNLLRGGFQTIQGGVSPSSERGAVGLTAKRLDPLGLALLAGPDQGRHLSLGEPKLWALLLGSGEPVLGEPLRCSPHGFQPAP